MPDTVLVMMQTWVDLVSTFKKESILKDNIRQNCYHWWSDLTGPQPVRSSVVPLSINDNYTWLLKPNIWLSLTTFSITSTADWIHQQILSTPPSKYLNSPITSITFTASNLVQTTCNFYLEQWLSMFRGGEERFCSPRKIWQCLEKSMLKQRGRY